MVNGNGANGVSHDMPQSAALLATIADNGHSVHTSPEQLQKIRELLSGRLSIKLSFRLQCCCRRAGNS